MKIEHQRIQKNEDAIKTDTAGFHTRNATLLASYFNKTVWFAVDWHRVCNLEISFSTADIRYESIKKATKRRILWRQLWASYPGR
jgi:hypothetical protein